MRSVKSSCLSQAGLQVGDMILAVNMDCLLGSTYDEVTIVQFFEQLTRDTVDYCSNLC